MVRQAHHVLKKTLFVCGTDTDVGKTIVTASLCAYLKSMGVKVAPFKPLESGCSVARDGSLLPADTIFLKKSAGVDEPINRLNVYSFQEALAPGVAAKRKKIAVSFSRISKALDSLEQDYDRVIIEGAGGLMVPLSGSKTNLDLIKHLKVPVLLVGRLGLGTINHTLLTWQKLKKEKINCVGVILNQTTKKVGLADQTNANILKNTYKLPVLGIFPHLHSPQKKLDMGRMKKSIFPQKWL